MFFKNLSKGGTIELEKSIHDCYEGYTRWPYIGKHERKKRELEREREEREIGKIWGLVRYI